MKINDIINEFLSTKHISGIYNVYGLNPKFTLNNDVHVQGSYIILDKESGKAKYKKIVNNKNILLLTQIKVGD